MCMGNASNIIIAKKNNSAGGHGGGIEGKRKVSALQDQQLSTLKRLAQKPKLKKQKIIYAINKKTLMTKHLKQSMSKPCQFT